jgi:hypothetical protein
LLFVRTRLAETVIGDADPMTTELIGWVSATILLATIGRQVYSQWRDRSSQGISRWLFVGKLGVRRHQRADAGHCAFRTVDLPA